MLSSFVGGVCIAYDDEYDDVWFNNNITNHCALSCPCTIYGTDLLATFARVVVVVPNIHNGNISFTSAPHQTFPGTEQ